MAIPSELQLTLRGENFLAYDSGSDDRERFHIFSTEQNLDLESTPQWHADGTFKCCPALFYQLYTVHCVLNGHTIPLVYKLLKRKTKELYLRALNELKEINPCLQPSQITIDFEIACLLAFEELFPKVSIKGKYIFRPHFNSFPNFREIYLIKEGEFEDSEYCKTFASVKGLISLFPAPLPSRGVTEPRFS